MFRRKEKKQKENVGLPMEEREKLGGKDIFALLLSAFLVLVLPCILVVLALGLLVLLLFGAL